MSDKEKTDYSASQFPSNNNTDNEQPRVAPDQVVTGKILVRKQSIWSKFRETFTGDDSVSIGEYILVDIIFPQVKQLVYDTITKGSERVLWPNGGSTPISNTGRFGKVNYNGMSSSPKRDISARARATHDFRDIVMDTRSDAVETLDQLSELCSHYGTATVKDLYMLCGITHSFQDANWGWTSMAQASVRTVRGGFRLDLPTPEKLND